MDLGVPEIGLILLAVFVLFGYKKLPDATRSLGRSLRIFQGEMKGMADDDRGPSAAPAVRPAADLLLAVVAIWLASNLRAGRTGRAWANVRDSETAAAAMGIAPVPRRKIRPIRPRPSNKVA